MGPSTITQFQIVVLPETEFRTETPFIFALDDQGKLWQRQVAIGNDPPVMDTWMEVSL